MGKMKEAAALVYEAGKDSAPYVAARGRGQIAEKIIEIAKGNSIPIFEDENAADILCKVQIGGDIPEVLYQVIAEIYAFILRMESQNTGKLNNKDK